MSTLKKVKSINLKKVHAAKNRDNKNLVNVKKAISGEKDLMYNYPKGADNLPARKKFRTDARRKRDSFLRKIENAKGTDRAALRKEATTWASKVFMKEYVPAF